MKFTRMPENTFKNRQLNAGILLKNFDVAGAEVTEEDILGATSGGVEFSATPSFIDFGEDIDNCPNGMLELMRIESWEVLMSGSFISIDAETSKLLTGAADVADGKITPRNALKKEDFTDLWWVGDYSDSNDGATAGYVAIHMMNTLSTGGFKLQSAKNEKGQFSFEFKAHYSMDKQDVVPFEVYVKAGAAE